MPTPETIRIRASYQFFDGMLRGAGRQLRETLIAYFTATIDLRGLEFNLNADRSFDLARESTLLMNGSLSLCATRYVKKKPHGRVC